MNDKKTFTVLVFIAVGIWLHLFFTVLPIRPVQATVVQDVNIVEVGGMGLPVQEGFGRYEALPIIIYEENVLGNIGR